MEQSQLQKNMTQMNWSKLSNKGYGYLLLSVGFVLNCSAQETLQDYKKAFPDYNEMVLSDKQSYNMTIDDGKIKVIEDNHYESMILTENGIQNNEESFTYSELVKLKSYEAYTIITNNGKEKKIKVTQSNEKNLRQNSVFFNDVKQRQLLFPNLEAGAKKVYDYQTEITDPFLLHKFVFGGGLPIKNSTLEIKTEKGIEIGYKVFNDPNNAIVFSKTEKKGKWLYQWTLNDVIPIKSEDNSQGYLYVMPHIDVYVKDYVVDDKKIEVLDDVKKLYEYYKGFTKNLNKTEDATLKAITLDITANQTSDEDKMKSIFYWVKDNIKYIAFENGYEGFIPREASLVCERKFGDCKDMASIISAMAKYANIPNVSVSWIGTRDIPYSYNELATPAVDNHMIAVYKKGEEYIFLDATDKETLYGIPTAFIQGKEALYSDGENYKIIPVPIVPAAKNEVNEVVKFSIEKDKIIGSGKLLFNGYNRSHTLMRIGDASNKTRFEMIKSLVLKGNNKFNLKEYSEENIKDRDKSYQINYTFDLGNYVIKVDKELYVNLFLDKPYEKLTLENDRKTDFEFDFLSLSNSQYEMEIPSNCTLKYLPKNFNLDNDIMKIDFVYEVKSTKIILNTRIALKKLVLQKPDFEVWNETIKKLKANYTETIILLEK
jgi:transglutaminase-like putative cysteine protease